MTLGSVHRAINSCHGDLLPSLASKTVQIRYAALRLFPLESYGANCDTPAEHVHA
jgi:hypothetical protein